MYKQTDTAILHFIMIVFMVFEALTTLISSINSSLTKKTKVLPEKKTTTQLNKMLKRELVELVIAYQEVIHRQLLKIQKNLLFGRRNSRFN